MSEEIPKTISTSRALALSVNNLVIGVIGGWCLCTLFDAERVDHIVAMRWGDGPGQPAHYGAQVYLVPHEEGAEVHARVLTGRGSGILHDFRLKTQAYELGKIGSVKTDAEAVQQFGVIDWRADGLHIGDGQTFPVFLEQSKLEASH